MFFLPAIAAAAIAFAPQDAKPAEVKLGRTYTVGEQTKYVIQVTPDGKQGEIMAKMIAKTVKLLDGGKATVEFTITDIQSGDDSPDLPKPFTEDLDAAGMPEGLELKDMSKLPVAILAIVGYLPPKIDGTKPYAMTWEPSDKSASIKGNISYDGTKDVNGKKANVLKYDLLVKPAGQSDGTMKSNASFDPDSGILLTADGTITIEGQTTLKFTVKAEKGS
jgi:hypothetical protein